MAHYCDVETQKGSGCRRRVNAASCNDHVNGPVPRKPGENRTPARSNDPPPEEPPHHRTQTKPPPTEKDSITLPNAITIVQQLPIDWQGRIAEQSVRLVGRKLWVDFLNQTSVGHCPPLAQTARELLAIEMSVARLPGETAAGAARRAGAPPAVQAIAERLASDLAITKPIEQKLATTAHAIRLLGVFLCVIANAVPTCQCLKDLVAENAPREEFETKLWHLAKPSMPT